jgi:hypothetical protein
MTRLLLTACVCFVIQARGALTLNASPGAVAIGGQPFTLSVSLTGTGAPAPQSTWAVRWNGSLRPTTMAQNGGQLTAAISASDIASPGFAEITIVNQSNGVVYQASAWVLITADVDVSDFAWDSVRNRFYVSVPAGSSRPNAPAQSVVAVDAVSGAVLSSINVGANPTLLSISDDAGYLYVYLSGSSAISRVALSSFTSDLKITLPSSGYVSWMQALPGAPHSLAVAQQSTGTNGTGALSIYDDTVARPSSGPGAPSRFLFTDSHTIVGYKYLDYMNGYTLQSWTVGPSGVGASSTTVASTSGQPVAYGDGWILCDDGQVFDPTGARPAQQLDLTGVGAFVPGQNRLLVFSQGEGNASPAVGAYEDVGMNALGRIQATTGYNSYPSQPTRMLVWGVDGVAFPVNNELFIGHTELAAHAPSFTGAAVVNSATLTTGGIAPGESLSIFGSNLGTPQGRSLEFSEPRQVSTALAETQVWFDGSPGVVLYAGGGQVNVVAPFELAGKTSTRVQVWYQGIPSAIVAIPVTPVAPGLFTQDACSSRVGRQYRFRLWYRRRRDPAVARRWAGGYLCLATRCERPGAA